MAGAFLEAVAFLSFPVDLVDFVVAAFPLDLVDLLSVFLVSFLPLTSFLPFASLPVDLDADLGPFLAAVALVSFLVVFFGALSFFLGSLAAFLPAFFSAAFFSLLYFSIYCL